MASMYYDKKARRWRVAWRCKLPGGTIDSGSKSFGKDKKTALEFKKHCDKNEKRLKNTIFIDPVYLTDVLEEWEQFCQKYTPDTRVLYTSEVGKFIEFLPHTVTYITDLKNVHINRYINYLMSRGLKNRTINNSLFSIKNLCRYMQENYKIPNPALEIKKLTEDPPDHNFLNEKEYNQVLSNCADIAKPWVIFLANTGLRASEFCRLQWKDCDLKERTITVVGKGRKRRTVDLNKTALAILSVSKLRRKVSPQDSVFLRSDGEPMVRYTLSNYILKACRHSGLSGGGPHALRHYFATSLLLRGIPIIKVSMLLGHTSVTITQTIYSHILPRDLKGVTSVLDAS